MESKPKKPKPKKKPKPETPQRPTLSNLDLSTPQKIPINVDTFGLMSNFCSGIFPPVLAPSEQIEHVVPKHCPHCRFGGGYEYVAEVATNNARYSRHDGNLWVRRAVRVQCISCDNQYLITETWSIACEFAQT